MGNGTVISGYWTIRTTRDRQKIMRTHIQDRTGHTPIGVSVVLMVKLILGVFCEYL